MLKGGEIDDHPGPRSKHDRMKVGGRNPGRSSISPPLSTYPPAFEDFAIIEEMPAMMRRGEPQAPYAKLKKRTLFGSTHPPAFADFAIIEGVPTMTRRGESHAPYTPGSSSSRPAPTRPRY